MRARIARYITAAALAAAVSFPGAAAAQDKPGQDSERFPAGPANMFRPGAAFTFYANTTDPGLVEGLNTALNTIAQQSQDNALTVETARQGITDGVAASNADQLARAAAVSIEGTFSIIVQAGFVRAMAQTNPALGRMLQTARTVVPLPGSESMDVPVLMAAAVHSLSIVSAGRKLREGPPAHDMRGTYELTVLGACALDDGDVTFTQTDFVVEGARGDALSLYGTVGAGKAYLVANERRFARISETNGGLPEIEVPDRPSDVFEADIPDDGGSFAFRSITRGECAFKLTPKA